jgi:exosortase/archaeosortase family protein
VAARTFSVPAWLSLCVALLITCAACFVSVRSLVGLLGTNDPTGLLAVAPLALIATLAVSIARFGPAEVPKLEPAMLGAVPTIFAGAAFLAFGPTRVGYAFWFLRLDVIGVALIALGACMALFGVRTIVRSRLIYLFLLLCLPPVLVPLLSTTTDLMTTATQHAAAGLARALPLGVDVKPGAEFVAAGGRRVAIVEACAGLDGIAALFLLAGPLLVGLRAPRRRDLWMLLVVAAVGIWFLNLLRVVGLLAAAGAGHQSLFRIVHSWGGSLLILIAVLGVLFGARLAGMRWRIDRLGTRITYSLKHAIVVTLLFAAGGGLAATGQVAQARDGLRLITVGNTPTVKTVELVDGGKAPVLRASGYDIHVDEAMPWFAQFFGRDSQAASYTLAPKVGESSASYSFARRGKDAGVWAQVVVTKSRRSLEQFSSIACYVAHGAKIYRTRQVALPGGSGTLVDQGIDHTRFTALGWTQKVRDSKGRTRYRRVVLFALAGRGSGHGVSVAQTRPERVLYAVTNMLSPYPERIPHGYNFDSGGDELLRIARAIVRERA